MGKKRSLVSDAAQSVKEALVSGSKKPGILSSILSSIPGVSTIGDAMKAFSFLPINAQQMILKTVGLPTNLTEKDLNTDQKLALYNSIKSAQERTGRITKGGTKYRDYGAEGGSIAGGKKGLGTVIAKSLVDPNYQMATTLGRTSYKNKGDSIIVTDKYDFSKGAFANTPNPNLYQMIRRGMGAMEPSNPTKQQKKDMAVRIALNKKDMQALNKKKNK
jgi:hypothetical protein